MRTLIGIAVITLQSCEQGPVGEPITSVGVTYILPELADTTMFCASYTDCDEPPHDELFDNLARRLRSKGQGGLYYFRGVELVRIPLENISPTLFVAEVVTVAEGLNISRFTGNNRCGASDPREPREVWYRPTTVCSASVGSWSYAGVVVDHLFSDYGYGIEYGLWSKESSDIHWLVAAGSSKKFHQDSAEMFPCRTSPATTPCIVTDAICQQISFEPDCPERKP